MRRVFVFSSIVALTLSAYASVLDKDDGSSGSSSSGGSSFGTTTEIKDSEIQMDLDVRGIDGGDETIIMIGAISTIGKTTIDNTKVKIEADVDDVKVGDGSQVHIGVIKNH